MAHLINRVHARPKDPHASVLLSLTRGGAGLQAWVCQEADGDNQSALVCIPLAELPAALFPQRDALLADWQSVCAARALNDVWPAFWRVFWSTLSETREQASLAMPQRVVPAARPVATAAHPRAFRGTKFKPPKQPAPELDLAAWLSDDRLLDGFFARHDFARLPVLDAQGQPSSLCLERNQTPSVAALLSSSAGLEPGQWPALPDAFRRAFLWQLRERPVSELWDWLELWRGLGSAHQGPGLTLAAQLCAVDPASHGWARLALTLLPARQIIFLDAVLKQRAYVLSCAELSANQLMELDAVAADDARFASYLHAVLHNLSRHVSTAYTLCACALANRMPEYRHERDGSRLRTAKNCTVVPMSDIVRMSAAVGESRQFWELRAWDFCGQFPGFDRILRETCWEQLGADSADQWMAIFSQIFWDEQDERKIDKRWRAHLAVFPDWQRGLASLSGPWQEKYVRMLRGHVGGWEDIDHFRESVPYLLPLQLRLCSAPFSADADGDCVLSAMAEQLPARSWRELAEADERTWLAIERACRRDNDAALIRRGLSVLALCWPDFLMQAFNVAPKQLVRSARLLGCLAYERRRQFLSETASNIWFATKWTELEPYEACRKLVQLCRDTGLNSPVPRRLRDHIEGSTALTTQQIARHCRIALARLPALLLAALEQAVWSNIDAPFNLRAHSTAASHAVRMLAGLDQRDNRRGLRRFLLAYAEGRGDAHLDHPLNRAWFARHPKIDQKLWNRPPQDSGSSAADPVRLGIETDPLEILMLGTYVGSCLGLGGVCQYSSVACLLDANKQVVYARDGAGRVLARQLLAIDERDRLICFAVYPSTADEALLSRFRAFNQQLAQALGIDIYRNQDDDEYEIAIVLAQDWRDDGVPDDGPYAGALALPSATGRGVM